VIVSYTDDDGRTLAASLGRVADAAGVLCGREAADFKTFRIGLSDFDKLITWIELWEASTRALGRI